MPHFYTFRICNRLISLYLIKELKWVFLATFLKKAHKFCLCYFFLVGPEREEYKLNDEHFAFGSVRTYPLIGMIGYSILLIASGDLSPLGFNLTPPRIRNNSYSDNQTI